MSSHLLVLLLAEAPLPGQTRAVGHAVRLRVLPSQIPHQELADNAQEPTAPRLQWHAQASAQDFGYKTWPGRASPPPRALALTLARPYALENQPLRLHQRAGPATTGHTIGSTLECNFLENIRRVEDQLQVLCPHIVLVYAVRDSQLVLRLINIFTYT